MRGEMRRRKDAKELLNKVNKVPINAPNCGKQE